MVKFDKQGNLYLADKSGKLMLLDDSLGIRKFTGFPRPLVDIINNGDDEVLVLGIGDLYPNDKLLGAVGTFDLDNFSTPRLIFDQLPRPVQFESGDIDADGEDDLLICNFGNYVGNLSYYHKTKDGYIPRLIKAAPGATRAFLMDIDGDT
ncbi:MAG: hypothetical protein P8X57_11970, partial [Cyclobacteriaceae bacterium]